MAMLHLLLVCEIKPILLHCNFRLRGEESDDDELFLRNHADKLGLTIYVQRFDTSKLAEFRRESTQECARNLRYEWFSEFLKQDNSYLITAHHQDDSIETFFINLLRGTGFRGLAGIPCQVGNIVRPFLTFSSEEINRYVDENGIVFREDSSNASDDYLRNKIRHHLVPFIHDVEPSFDQKMTTFFEKMNQLKDHIAAEVGHFEENYRTVEDAKFVYPLGEVKSRSSFFIEQLFYQFGVHHKNHNAFIQFLDAKTGATFLTNQFQFWVDRDRLIIKPWQANEVADEYGIIDLPVEINLNGLLLQIKKESMREFDPLHIPKKSQMMDFKKLAFPLVLRKWKHGDRINPLGMSGTKLVSDILIDKKVPQPEKSDIWLLVDATNVVICLLGMLISDSVKIDNHTTEWAKISLRDKK